MSGQPNEEGKPAMTIVIQSWATPLIGLAMLVLGLAAGYFIRPALIPGPDATAGAAPTAQASVPTSAAAAQPPASALPTADPSQAGQDLMAFLIGQTVHFRGDPNAPITMIEFSDYQ
jgi:hypothetical protein